MDLSVKVLAAECSIQETGQGHYWCHPGDGGACAEMFSRSRAHGECPRGSELACILRHRGGTTDSDHGCTLGASTVRVQKSRPGSGLCPAPTPCFSAASVNLHTVSSGTTVPWGHTNVGALVVQSSGVCQGSMSHVRAVGAPSRHFSALKEGERLVALSAPPAPPEAKPPA